MKKEAPVTPSTSYRTPVLICIGLLLLVFLPYAPVCVQGFSVLDDDDYVVRNSIVHAGITWKGFIWALTTNAVANWHPLTWLSHMLDCQLFGVNPGYHHLVNLLLHMANTVLLFLLFRSMTHTLWRSAFIAGLFAVHPLHVESVAWISERKDVLSAFFWILSTCAYVSYVRQPKLLRYLLVMILFALGLMAKPMLVTLPCVFLLLDYWPLERYPSSSFRKNRYSKSMPFLILEKLPLLALSLASSIITYVVQQQAGAVRSTDAISLSLRFGNAVVGYARYLAKALWPHDLAVYYPYSTHGLPLWQICIALLALGSITVFVLRHARERGYLFTGWFWFLGTLVPVIGIVQVGSQAIADRYMYVPIIGLFIMVTWIFAEIGTLILQRTFPENLVIVDTDETSSKKKKRNREAEPQAPKPAPHSKLLAIPAISLVLVSTIACGIQVRYWSDNVTLFQHAVDVTFENDVGLFNLGIALKREDRLNEAAEAFQEAIRIRPNYVNAYIYLGLIRYDQKKYEEAVEYYNSALDYSAGHPNHGDAENNLAIALAALGKQEEAIIHYQKAIQLSPDDANKRFNLGNALFAVKRYDEASAQFEQALQINPGLAPARDGLAEIKKMPKAQQKPVKIPQLASAEEYFKEGNSLADSKNYAEAAANFEEAVRLRPDFIDARVNLGNALAVQGRLHDAAVQFREVIKVQPNNADAHINLGNVCAELGELTQAEAEFKQALALKPGNVDARCALGYVFVKRGKLSEASEEFSKALALDPSRQSAQTALKKIKEHLGEK